MIARLTRSARTAATAMPSGAVTKPPRCTMGRALVNRVPPEGAVFGVLAGEGHLKRPGGAPPPSRKGRDEEHKVEADDGHGTGAEHGRGRTARHGVKPDALRRGPCARLLRTKRPAQHLAVPRPRQLVDQVDDARRLVRREMLVRPRQDG